MLDRLGKLLGGRKAPPEMSHERLLALEREVQGLRLELAERERALANCRSELERRREGERARIVEAERAQMERLLSDLAAPVAQLLTQKHLLESEGKPVRAADVLAVANRLVRALEDEGLAPVGSIGQTVEFDPDLHEPLGAAVALAPGRPVVVRFVGAAYRGKVLRRAAVEPAAG